MKNRAVKPPLTALLALLAVCAAMCAFFGTTAADASTHEAGDYRYEYVNYAVTYDVNPDCEIYVTEDITIHYLGRDSTGFRLAIPTNAGAQVKNIRVKGVQVVDGKAATYAVSIEDNNHVTVDIGDSSHKKDDTEQYIVTYSYCIGNMSVKAGTLSVNPISTDNACKILNADVTILLPDGYIDGRMFKGANLADKTGEAVTATTENGRTAIKASFEGLNEFEGVSYDLRFERGAIRPYFDFVPYYFVIAAAALIVAILLVKLLFFSKTNLTPVVGFEAPEGMDPLLMGKLIDNKVNSEDVTALIFYWADKGYLKINLDNKDNPTIIKIKNLPATAKNYEQTVFAGLFRGGDSVTTNDLKYVFYPTFEKATALVNEQAKGLFMSSSIGVSVIFALLGGILLGLAPLLSGILFIAPSLIFFYSFIAIIPALVLYGLTETVMYNRLKNKGGKNALFFGLLALGILACSAVFTLAIPGALMPLIPKLLLSVLGFSAVAAAVAIISRTREYTNELNGIVGFRNFIIYAEKERLEALLEDDPQYYFHVLPYAQVLNVSDKWEEKFKEITVPPPVWATSSLDTILSFALLNSMIRRSTVSITAGMISRPSSSGSGLNGGGAGGGFGGFGGSFGGSSGGGFGGSGSRGR